MAPTPAKKTDDLNNDEDRPNILSHTDVIDPATFEQILEMDDEDDEREFSKGIVYGFFEQAETTFANMKKALASEDFDELSRLGHFLKGSSATLGLTKVRDACEKLQHCKDDLPDKKDEAERKKAVEAIEQILKDVTEDYDEVSKLLKRFYGEKIQS